MADETKRTGKLTAKQQLFVKEYLVDLIATHAAIRAGYSQRNAKQIGYNLLAKPQVARAVAEAQAKRAEKLDITAERVLRELARIGFADPRKLFTEDGRLKPIGELDDETAASIAS